MLSKRLMKRVIKELNVDWYIKNTGDVYSCGKCDSINYKGFEIIVCVKVKKGGSGGI